MSLRMRIRPPAVGFIEPCLPSNAPKPPAGDHWLHEIKHDGYRLMARRDAAGVRLLTRNGHDWSARFPAIVHAVDKLRVRSCLIDGEAVACDGNGVAVFQLLRRRRDDQAVFLYAFDLLELDGVDYRREPIEDRKARLARLLSKASPGIRFNEHIEAPADVVFKHACRLGLEGIVSKRRGSRYQSGRSPHWLKSKNPAAPAVARLETEDWN
jgi:bifunctional non-homologous end joining protein LigD